MKNRAAWPRSAVGRPVSVPDAWMAPRVGRLRHGAPGELLVACGDRGAVPARLVAGLDRRALLDPANRDREVWGPTADEFDIHRPRRTHLRHKTVRQF